MSMTPFGLTMLVTTFAMTTRLVTGHLRLAHILLLISILDFFNLTSAIVHGSTHALYVFSQLIWPALSSLSSATGTGLNRVILLLFLVLGHLFTPDDLPEAVIELFLEEDLGLSSTDKDLPDELRIVNHLTILLGLLLACSFASRAILLGLCSDSFSLSGLHEDVVLHALYQILPIYLLTVVELVVFQ